MRLGFAALLVGQAMVLLADVSMTDTRALAERRHAQKLEAKRSAGESASHTGQAARRAKHLLSTTATGSQQLIDNSGLKWFINTDITFSTSSSASGGMSEASYTHAVAASTSAGGTTSSTLNDAYDGYQSLCISPTNAAGPCETGNANYVEYVKTGAAATTECLGGISGVNRQVVFPVQTVGGTLKIQRKVFVPDNDTFARWMNIFTNTGATTADFTMITSNNLGSDSNTRIVSSSSGDNVAQTSDTWITSFQNFSGNTTSDPRLGHVMQGVGAPVPVNGIFFIDGQDRPWWSYHLQIPAGQTWVVVNFGVAQPTKAAANAKSALLATFPAAANSTQCMTGTDLAEVVNFAVGSDVSITNTASAPVVPGGPLNYTIVVSDVGTDATGLSVTDTIPAGTTFVSASGTGWTCGQAAGTVTCTLPTLTAGTSAPAITIAVTAPGTAGPISDTATVTSTSTDSNPGNNSATANSTTGAGAVLEGTKTVSGNFSPGGAITYTVVLTNFGAVAQGDNPGNEFTDVLPASLTLTSATASSGAVVANVGTNTVTWNGGIPAGGSATITINATINSNASGLISNQGSYSFDADNNGTNETTEFTSSTAGVGPAPPVGGPTPTTFAVGINGGIPTLSPRVLAMLGLLLAGTALLILRKR